MFFAHFLSETLANIISIFSNCQSQLKHNNLIARLKKKKKKEYINNTFHEQFCFIYNNYDFNLIV